MILSIGDILTALIYIPVHVTNVHLSQVKDPCIGYSIEQFIGVFLGTSATILTSIICMDRYFFISRPYRNTGTSVNASSSRPSSSNHADRSTRKLFATYCILAFSIALALGITIVTIANGSNNFRAATVFNIVSIVIYILMLFTSLIFNTLLVRYVYKQAREIKRMTRSDNVIVVQKPYRNKATKTVLLISGIQIFTILPWITSLAYMTFEFGEDGYVEFIDEIYYMHVWLKMPMFLNSFLNAVVFIQRNQHLLKFYRALSTRVRSVRPPVTT